MAWVIRWMGFWQPLAVIGFLQAAILALTILVLRGQTKAVHNSERAWVLVTMGALPKFKPNPNKVEFLWIAPIFKNYGKTPARITKIVAKQDQIEVRDGSPGQLSPNPKYFQAPIPVEIADKDIVLAPNTPMQPIRIPVPLGDFIAIRRRQKSLYIYGFLDYRDTVSNKRHQTRFCFIYWIQSGFDPDESGFSIAGNTPASYIRCT